MVIEISNYLNRVEASQFSIFTQKFHNSVAKTLKKFNGNIEKNDNNSYLVSFQSVSDAVLCALKVQFKFKYVTPKHEAFNRRLNIALSTGSLFEKNKILNEKGVHLALRMCEIIKEQLVISAEVNSLYINENQNAEIDPEFIRVLTIEEEHFLTEVMDHMESNWSKPSFSVDNFSRDLGYNKSYLYRKLIKLTGKSPGSFIKEFRLHKALVLLHDRNGSISDIAIKTGFNSPSYFSKCFFDKYGILPSKYIQQHT